LPHLRSIEIGSSDLPRRIRHDLACRQDTGADEIANDVTGHLECASRLEHRQAAAVFDRGRVAADSRRAPVGDDSGCRPRVSLAGRQSHSVEGRGDVCIRPAPGHLAYDCRCLRAGAPRVLATARLAHPQLRVLATAPMDRQYDLASRVINVDDDFLDQRTDQALLGPHVDGWRAPRAFEISPKPEQLHAHRRRRLVRHTAESRASHSWSRVMATFQRASSSAATSRLSGSTASYRRRASVTSYSACWRSSSIARRRSSTWLIASRSATMAASTARGSTAIKTSRAIAASGRRAPKVMQGSSPCIMLPIRHAYRASGRRPP